MTRLQPTEDEVRLARKGRKVALVVAATMVLWFGVQLAGAAFGLPVRIAFLFDFAAIAAFVWALVVTYQLWQARGSTRPPNGG
ncbi:DUF5337 domain-containing protein [Mangrovicoccus sp. HB161399]|uniref:DUF5337 domain-containing protein n=1 Tax=Mangrovicoccus sp. HB161399 TaxID=2720392 RepID=UPI001557FB25|nr:DUF5337 domain-containing protein [Mangrovicoccus sp. HB161399]